MITALLQHPVGSGSNGVHVVMLQASCSPPEMSQYPLQRRKYVTRPTSLYRSRPTPPSLTPPLHLWNTWRCNNTNRLQYEIKINLIVYDLLGNGVKRHQVLSDGTRDNFERAWSAICGESVGISDSLLFTVKLEVLIHAKTTMVHTSSPRC